MEEFWLVGNRNSVAYVGIGSDCHIWYERDSASDVTHSGKFAVAQSAQKRLEMAGAWVLSSVSAERGAWGCIGDRLCNMANAQH